MDSIINIITTYQAAKTKKLAILVDPDKAEKGHLSKLAHAAQAPEVAFFLVGGSLLFKGDAEQTINDIKAVSSLPVVIFPGSSMQVCGNADAVFFLSLISGRNPQYLIGDQVIAAPVIKKLGIESIAVGYMLIDGGIETSVSYISNTKPIPQNKPEIAACTALAGQMLGLSLIYLDAGSGAINPVSVEMVKAVKSQIDIPLIVGGGIKTAAAANKIFNAGADIIVVGNVLENNPNFLNELVVKAKKE